MITSSIEIARRPEEVFAYLDELDKHGEWQEAIVSVRKETEGPTGELESGGNGVDATWANRTPTKPRRPGDRPAARPPAAAGVWVRPIRMASRSATAGPVPCPAPRLIDRAPAAARPRRRRRIW